MQTKTSNDYFSESANNVSFFFEEHAFDAHGQLRQPKALSINKMGHGTALSLLSTLIDKLTCVESRLLLQSIEQCVLVAAMHDLDPVFMKWSRSARVAELLQDLGYKKPTPVQSMYIFKVSTSGLAVLHLTIYDFTVWLM